LRSYKASQVVVKEIKCTSVLTLSENLKQHAFECSQASAIYSSDKGGVSPLKSSAHFNGFNIKTSYDLKRQFPYTILTAALCLLRGTNPTVT
jgi:hypothetical protein